MGGTRHARVAVASTLAAVLDDAWTVYPWPPATVTAPAAVLAPRDPYISPGTYKRQDLGLRLTLLVPVALGAYAGDILDDALDAARDALEAAGGVIDRTGEHAVVTEGGTEHIACVVDFTWEYDPAYEPPPEPDPEPDPDPEPPPEEPEP